MQLSHEQKVRTRGSFLIYVPSAFVLAVNTKPCTIKLHRSGLLGDLAELGVPVNLKENKIVFLCSFSSWHWYSTLLPVLQEAPRRHRGRAGGMASHRLALQHWALLLPKPRSAVNATWPRAAALPFAWWYKAQGFEKHGLGLVWPWTSSAWLQLYQPIAKHPFAYSLIWFSCNSRTVWPVNAQFGFSFRLVLCNSSYYPAALYHVRSWIVLAC